MFTNGPGWSRRTFLVRSGAAAAASVAWAAGCRVPDAGRPNARNTGVPAGTTLRRHDGNLRVTTPNEVVEDLDIRGFVTIAAPGVRMRRCRVRGGAFRDMDADPRGPKPAQGWPNPSLVFCPDGRGFVIEDCLLLPDAPSFWIDGIKGYGFTARRLDISRVQDTALCYGNDVVFDRCFMHDHETGAFDPRGAGDGPSHSDGVQVQGGRNVRITGCSFGGAYNAAIQVTQDHAKTDDLLIEGNWLGGGQVSVNISQKPRGPITGVILRNNRFDRNQHLGKPGFYDAGTELTQTGNVWDDNGEPLTIRKVG